MVVRVMEVGYSEPTVAPPLVSLPAACSMQQLLSQSGSSGVGYGVLVFMLLHSSMKPVWVWYYVIGLEVAILM